MLGGLVTVRPLTSDRKGSPSLSHSLERERERQTETERERERYRESEPARH